MSGVGGALLDLDSASRWGFGAVVTALGACADMLQDAMIGRLLLSACLVGCVSRCRMFFCQCMVCRAAGSCNALQPATPSPHPPPSAPPPS
jgi:hypothetical protein